MLKPCSLLATALVAVAFPISVHGQTFGAPPEPLWGGVAPTVETPQAALPTRSISEMALSGLRWAIAQKMVSGSGEFASKLRTACVLLQRSSLDEVAAQTGIKATVLLRLIDLGGQTNEVQTTDTARNTPTLPQPATARDVARRYSRQSP